MFWTRKRGMHIGSSGHKIVHLKFECNACTYLHPMQSQLFKCHIIATYSSSRSNFVFWIQNTIVLQKSWIITKCVMACFKIVNILTFAMTTWLLGHSRSAQFVKKVFKASLVLLCQIWKGRSQALLDTLNAFVFQNKNPKA